MTKAVTRARTKTPPPIVAERVERIVGMMRVGQWVRGVSAGLLAQEWGLATATVEALSAEASRVVAREVTDPQRVQEDVATILMRDIERASAAGEFGDVARIGDVVTRILGARAPERKQVDVNVQAVSSLSDEDKLEMAEKQYVLLREQIIPALRARVTKKALPAVIEVEAEDE